MDEASRTVEMLVGQIDKRMAFIEQNLIEIRGELGQIRAEINQLHLGMRNNLRWTITTMVALFGAAVPIWMWVLGTLLRVR